MPREILQRFAETLDVQIARFVTCGNQVVKVGVVSHSEEWEVMQHGTEQLPAVLAVLARVEDVRMPEAVDDLVRDDILARVLDHKDEEPLIPLLSGIRLFARHAFAGVGIHELILHGVDIESEDLGDHCFALFSRENNSVAEHRFAVTGADTLAQVLVVSRTSLEKLAHWLVESGSLERAVWIGSDRADLPDI